MKCMYKVFSLGKLCLYKIVFNNFEVMKFFDIENFLSDLKNLDFVVDSLLI